MMLLALAAMLATGCRSSRMAATAPTAGTEAPRYTAMTFTGDVDGIGVNGQVRMRQDSVIWCSVSKFVELGRALATPDSVWVRMPLLNKRFAGNYRDLERTTGVKTSFAELQEVLESPDAEARIATIAQRLGHNATIRITRREQKESLNFPFNK